MDEIDSRPHKPVVFKVMLGVVPRKIRKSRIPQASLGLGGGELSGSEEVNERKMSRSQQAGRTEEASTERKGKKKKSWGNKEVGSSSLTPHLNSEGPTRHQLPLNLLLWARNISLVI